MEKRSTTVVNLAERAVLLVLVLMPFHAFVTVYTASLVGHYTLLRLWKEFVLLGLMAYAAFIAVKDAKIRRELMHGRLFRYLAACVFLQVILAVAAYGFHHVTLKATAYGMLSNTRYLLFFMVVWVVARQGHQLHKHWPRVVFWPAAVVIAFGLLQYFVLPYDFLKHFGYSEATIFPYTTINHNLHYIRIMSTLRGANPLGAYLVLVLSLLGATLLLRVTWRRIVLAAGGALALLLTFSRSAWIGLVAAVIRLGITPFVQSRRFKRYLAPAVVVVVVACIAGGLLLRHNIALQNAVLHTQDHSQVATSSNQGHVSAFKGGLRDIERNPLGQGPGSAGPASVYNVPHKARIAENYYLQVGQEVGWLGLALFLVITYQVFMALWRRRTDPLALGLCAALLGLTVVNMLSHAWADDTLAYLFWGLAGIALAKNQPVTKGKTSA